MQRTGNRYKRQKSCTIYISFEERTEDGGAPGYQASYARLNLMYRHRYEDISQVGFYLIETEEDFYNTWRDMPENPNTDKIDEVVVIMHGMYYAMMINTDAKENLTVSPDGKVGSDKSALRISDLPVRNIETIRLNSCNTGLLNAINTNLKKDMNANEEDGVQYQIQGNVAQAFLNSQNVHEVYAWDGNTNPRTRSGAARLSNTQTGFHDALRSIIVSANSPRINRVTWNDLILEKVVGVDVYIPGRRDMPVGEVRYIRTAGGLYCTYEYAKNRHTVYGYVNLANGVGQQFEDNENMRDSMIG